MAWLWRNKRLCVQLASKAWQHPLMIRQMEKQYPYVPEPEKRVADDLLIGADAIAAFIGVSRRSVYHLAREKQLPIGRLGKQLIARKSQLRRHIDSRLI